MANTYLKIITVGLQETMAASSKYRLMLGGRHMKGVQEEEKSHDTDIAIQQARKWIEVGMANLKTNL